MFYIDTSVLVSALTRESGTARAQSWLKANSAAPFFISPWVITELNSALAMKLRLEIISVDERANIIFEFEHLRASKLRLLEFSNAHFFTAAHYASNHHFGLRASDALHLAIAADHDAVLCTLDQRLHDACKALKIMCEMP